jgi:hypothetical protein
MTSFYSKNDYKLIGFRKSIKRLSKYDAILENKKNKKIVIVPFGGIRPNGIPYEQFKDRVPLKLYTKYDHGDEDRRLRYLKRHSKNINEPYSKSYFSEKYLWT